MKSWVVQLWSTTLRHGVIQAGCSYCLMRRKGTYVAVLKKKACTLSRAGHHGTKSGPPRHWWRYFYASPVLSSRGGISVLHCHCQARGLVILDLGSAVKQRRRRRRPRVRLGQTLEPARSVEADRGSKMCLPILDLCGGGHHHHGGPHHGNPLEQCLCLPCILFASLWSCVCGLCSWGPVWSAPPPHHPHHPTPHHFGGPGHFGGPMHHGGPHHR